MKTLYESILTGKVTKPRAKAQPSSKDELKQIIDGYIEEIKSQPGQEVDFNWIDISLVDDLSELFTYTEYVPVIDKWKIDHVKDFSDMFNGNKHIKRSPFPVLQKKLLIRACYYAMFLNCTALEEPPVLPATELTVGCYTDMFNGCTALKKSPELPAMDLAEKCYWDMFNGCTSLVEPPELPAVKMVRHCYQTMFFGCRSLRKKAKTPSNIEDDNIDYSFNMYLHCPCNK